jgi:hypothetical protein
VGAVTAHPTLRTLKLSHNGDYHSEVRDACVIQRANVAASALEALIAADAPALTELDADNVWLGHAGMRRIFSALRHNTHLRVLHCGFGWPTDLRGGWEEPTQHFQLLAALPMARFYTTLRSLTCDCPAAEEFVKWRAAAAAHAEPPLLPQRSRTCFDALPSAAVVNIFGRLPVDCRLRCLEVCTSWYVMVGGEQQLWTRIDLSRASGIAWPPSDTLLLAAAARAEGELEALDLTGCGQHISMDALDEAWCVSAEEKEYWFLDALHLSGFVPFRIMLDEQHGCAWLASTTIMSRTALALELGCDREECFGRFEADVACADIANAQLLLSHAYSFDALRLQQLLIGPEAAHTEEEDERPVLTLSECDVATLSAVMEAHPSMWALHVARASLDASALVALVAAAAAQRLTRLTMCACRFDADDNGGCAAGAALASLLAPGGCLLELDVSGCRMGDATLRLLRVAAAAGAVILCCDDSI